MIFFSPPRLAVSNSWEGIHTRAYRWAGRPVAWSSSFTYNVTGYLEQRKRSLKKAGCKERVINLEPASRRWYCYGCEGGFLTVGKLQGGFRCADRNTACRYVRPTDRMSTSDRYGGQWRHLGTQLQDIYYFGNENIILYYIILYCTILYFKLNYIMSHQIILHYVILYYITLRYIILCYITLYYITLYIILYFIILHHIIFYYIILYYTILLFYIIFIVWGRCMSRHVVSEIRS